MKKSYLMLAALAAGSCFVSCEEEYSEPSMKGQPVINTTDAIKAYFGDSIKLAVNVKDASNVNLSTLSARLLFADEPVDQQVIRTKNDGEYTVKLAIPFVAKNKGGNADLELVLENVTGAKDTKTITVSVARPDYEYILLVDAEGNEQKMTKTENEYEYAITADFEKKQPSMIKLPKYGENGNEIMLGYSAGQVEINGDKMIPFSNSSAGKYTISFNTFDFSAAPFIVVSNFVDFADNVADVAFEQGEDITFGDPSAIEGLWMDPDYFVKNGSKYSFNAVSGTYRLEIDEKFGYIRVYAIDGGEPAALSSNATGALWAVGEGIGKPTAKGHSGWDPSTTHAICMAEVKPSVFQLTLVGGTMVGTESINFKFFGGLGWANEFGPDRISSTSDVVLVGNKETNGKDNGNLFLAEGATLDANGIYVFTVDMTAGQNNAVLSVEKVGDVQVEASDAVIVNGTEMTTLDNAEYTATVSLSQGDAIKFTGIDNLADFWVDADYFNGDINALKLNAVSGEYKITVDKALKIISAVSTANTLSEDGHGTIWNLGWGLGKVSLAEQPGWNPGKGIPFAEVAPGVFQMTGVAGEEGDETLGVRIRANKGDWDCKFFHQDGWGGEFAEDKGNNLTVAEECADIVSTGSGNLSLLADLEKGATYVMTVDLTAGVDKGVFSIVKK